jgi:hypothetical protein
MSESSTGETVVLIHGLWMTPRSWEKWVERFEGRGQAIAHHAAPKAVV